MPTVTKDGLAVASFAGGCFWGTELHFQRLPGVVATCVGYTQGRTEKPSYKEVCGGTTGHTEGRESRAHAVRRGRRLAVSNVHSTTMPATSHACHLTRPAHTHSAPD